MVFLMSVSALDVSRSDWSDRNELHKNVMSWFDPTLDGAAHERRKNAKILFRVEESAQGTIVLVRSESQATRQPSTALVKEFQDPVLSEGVLIRFRLVVNAIERLGKTTRLSNAHSVRPVSDVSAWLQRKLSPALSELTVLSHDRQVVKKSSSLIQLDTVDGVARVGDSLSLVSLCSDGVGRAKAYGCGLLTVAIAR